MTARNRKLAALLLVLAAGTAVYLPSLGYDFVNWDDPAQILTNPLVRDLSHGGLRRIFTSRVVRQYHPLTTLSFAIEYRLFGAAPRPYRLHNLVLHLLNSALVFALAGKLSGGRLLPASLAALLFALHPASAGAVAWISGRKDLLAAFFFLAALLAYLRRPGNPAPADLVFVSLFGLMAIIAKATAAILPAALLLLDWQGERRLTPRLLLEKLPLLLAAGGAGVLAFLGQLQPVPGETARYGWALGNLALSGRTLFFYLRAALFPLGLRPLYPAVPPAGFAAGLILAAIPPLLFSGGFSRGRGGRARTAAALFFLLGLLPVSRIFPYGGSEEVALRFLYLPLIGGGLLAGLSIDALFPAGNKRATAVIALLLAAAGFGVLSRQTARYWTDGGTFWGGTVRGYPEFDLARHQLAVHYYARGDYLPAIREASRAIELNPEIAFSYVIKGLSLGELGETGQAVSALRRGRRILREMGRIGDADRVDVYLKDLGYPDADRAEE